MRFSVYPFIWLAFSGGGVLAAILLPWSVTR
jgi:fumarate reductase subunit D